MASPTDQVKRWVGIAAGIWVQAMAGNGNVFPHFAPTLKQQLQLNQVEINNLGVAKDFGDSVGLVAGMLSNLLSPWIILLIGALEGLFGFGTLWLVMSGYIAPLQYWQMCGVLLIGANSTTYFNTAVLVTTMRNFPESRGMVVGIVKGFVGLSSAIFTQFFVAILHENATELVLLLALGPFTVCLIVMYFIQPVGKPGEQKSPAQSHEEANGFTVIHVVCLGLALYLLLVTLFESFLDEISPLMYQVIIACMLAFLLAPLLVPAQFAYKHYLIGGGKVTSSHNSHTPPKLEKNVSTPLPSTLDNSLRTPLPSTEVDCLDTPLPSTVDDNLRAPLASTFDENLGTPLPSNVDESLRTPRASNLDDSLRTPLLSDKQQGTGAEEESGPSPRYSAYDTSKLSSEHGDGEREEYREGYLGGSPISRIEGDAGTLLAVGEGAVRRRRGPRRGEDFTLAQALVKADFWLLFFTYFCGMGTGIMVINNLGQIGQAQGYSDVSIFVSLFAIMNFLGRLGGGALSERFVRSAALPRTVWMLAAQVLMIFGHVLFATALPGTLYAGSVVLGLCFGVNVAIMVPTASELFGLRHFGMIYNFITMGNPFGSLLFSGIVAGYLYDKASDNSPSVHGTVSEPILSRSVRNLGLGTKVSCLGAHCYQLTFIIMALVCVVGAVLNLFLTWRIRRVYRSLYGSRNPSYQDLTQASGEGSTPAASSTP